MNWFSKVGVFYKLANEAEYKSGLHDLLTSAMSNVEDFARFISNWDHASYFNLLDVAPGLIAALSVHNDTLNNRLQFWKQRAGYFRVKKENIDKMMQLIVEDYLEHSPSFDVMDYISVLAFKEAIGSEIVGQAEQKIIATILEYADLYENGNISEEEVVEELSTLKNYAHGGLSQKIIEELIKMFGVDIYVKVKGKDYVPDLFKMDKLSIFDVAARMSVLGGGMLNKKLMLEIIGKSDAEIRQYLRSLVYYEPGNFFILDENMKPMNENYQEMAWPEGKFGGIRLSQLSSENQKFFKQKWMQILEEFNVIPA